MNICLGEISGNSQSTFIVNEFAILTIMLLFIYFFLCRYPASWINMDQVWLTVTQGRLKTLQARE